MNFKLILDKNHVEEVIVYAHEVSETVKKIENLINGNNIELTGYKDKKIVKITLNDVCCFTMENNKLIAITEKGNFQIKERLYRIEEIVYDGFIKINQSTLVKRIDIERFEVSVGGALMVVLKNGYKDYVSRRQLKKVKERLGL
jgi:DNA-binding LytR/AlgR family response regulator